MINYSQKFLKQFIFTFFLVIMFSSSIFLTNGSNNTIDVKISENYIKSQKINKLVNEENTKTIELNPTKNWTYMVFFGADSAREELAISDFEKLEAGGGTTDDVNVIAFIDRAEGYDTSNGDWTEARYYQIENDTSTGIVSTQLASLGEVDYGDPSILKDFIEYCFDHYPAEHYCLNIWGFGDACYGCLWDQGFTPDSSHISINELQQVLSQIKSTYGEKIDILSFTSAWMASIEIVWEVRNYIDYYIAKQDKFYFETNDGLFYTTFDYETIISELTKNPNLTAEALCQVIINSYKELYETGIYSSALSAISLSDINSLYTSIEELTSNLIYTFSELNFDYAISLARSTAITFNRGDLVDIGHFAVKLANVFRFYPELVEIANDIIELVDSIVLYNYQHNSYNNRATGLNIYLPISSYETYTEDVYNYVNDTNYFAGIDWLSDSNWNDFVLLYHETFGFNTPPLPTSLQLDTPIEGLELENKQMNEFYFYVNNDGYYDFTVEVLSGDVDVFLLTANAQLNFLFNSTLFNSLEESKEFIHANLTTGSYYLFIYSNTDNSNYTILVSIATDSANISIVVYGVAISIIFGTTFYYRKLKK